MKKEREIRDDEIRLIGDGNNRQHRPQRSWFTALLILLACAACYIVWLVSQKNRITQEREDEPAYFEPYDSSASAHGTLASLGTATDSLESGFCEIIDTVINDIPLRLYFPHNAKMTLQIGLPDKQDTTIIYAAQAADIRRDNGKIVGAFVLKGEPLSWGLSKRGFCASINGKITIGVAESTHLFEEAVEHEGYFFRQYPLVKDGELIDNEPKNKSIRRAVCSRNDDFFMAESMTRESFHDFAQALVDIGAKQAIYLVGSSAYGWAVDNKGEYIEFGEYTPYTKPNQAPANINYMVWRKSSVQK